VSDAVRAGALALLALGVLLGSGCRKAVISDEGVLSGEYYDRVVLIEGDRSVGTGFLLELKGVQFVVTNLHVLAGNEDFTMTTADGRELERGKLFGAVGRDVALIRLREAVPNTFVLPEDVAAAAAIGDEVVVPGNEGGAGVATAIHGTVRGVGAELVEVDAKFIQGNSGSPIIHVASDRPIGIATYVVHYETDPVSRAANSRDVRWFGARVDGIGEWEEIHWPRFVKQGKMWEAIRATTDDLFALLSEDNRHFYGADSAVRRVVSRFEERVRESRNRVEAARAVKSFSHRIRAVCEADLGEMEQERLYDFFARQLEEERRARARMVEVLEILDERVREAVR